MIHLAIDEMLHAECGMQKKAGEDRSSLQPPSACCIHPALREEQIRREEAETRLKQIHLQAGNE